MFCEYCVAAALVRHLNRLPKSAMFRPFLTASIVTVSVAVFVTWFLSRFSVITWVKIHFDIWPHFSVT